MAVATAELAGIRVRSTLIPACQKNTEFDKIDPTKHTTVFDAVV